MISNSDKHTLGGFLRNMTEADCFPWAMSVDLEETIDILLEVKPMQTSTRFKSEIELMTKAFDFLNYAKENKRTLLSYKDQGTIWRMCIEFSKPIQEKEIEDSHVDKVQIDEGKSEQYDNFLEDPEFSEWVNKICNGL